MLKNLIFLEELSKGGQLTTFQEQVLKNIMKENLYMNLILLKKITILRLIIQIMDD